MSTSAWTYHRNFDRTGEFEIFDGERSVAIVLNREDGVHDEEIAILIAAAPDMLKVLQALVRGLVDGPDQSDAAMLVTNASAAIAKATCGEV